MEALTIKIDSHLNEMKREMKEIRDGCTKCGGPHPSWDYDDKLMGGPKEEVNYAYGGYRGGRYQGNYYGYHPPPARTEHVYAVYIRSGRTYDPPTNPLDKIIFIHYDSDDKAKEKADEDDPTPSTPKQIKPIPVKAYKPRILINVPLVDVLVGMPNYGKFLKELLSNKNKLKEISVAFLNEEYSAIIQNKIPPKLRDPRSFLIPCTLGNAITCNALVDLGASINLMPYSLYAKLLGGTIKPTRMCIRLANQSYQYPVGVAENMLVQVGQFIFLIDFVILEMEEDSKVPLILGRPFLHTANAIIYVKCKELNLEVGNEKITFMINKAMQHSHSNDDTCFNIDVIDEVTEEELDALLNDSGPFMSTSEKINETDLDREFVEFMEVKFEEAPDKEVDEYLEELSLEERSRIKKSIQVPPTDLEMKPLPDHLEYAYLEKDSLFLVIIAFNLKADEKERLDSRCMIAIFQDMLETTMEVFMYGFSVFGDSFGSCLLDLDQMLIRCKRASIVLNWEKCHFMVTEGIMLGHKVSGARLEVDKSKIEVISKLPPPTNVKAVRIFDFNEECTKAFETLKDKLANAPIMISPDWSLPFELMCDASNFAVGAVLGQREGKHFRHIHFASKTLNNAQQNYMITEKNYLL
ncbi:reverse transcriptase domain-containing protein [Tanacetum coccineum]